MTQRVQESTSHHRSDKLHILLCNSASSVTAVDEAYVISLNRVSHLMCSGITITKLPQGNYFESIRHTNMVWQKPIKDKNEEKRQKNK